MSNEWISLLAAIKKIVYTSKEEKAMAVQIKHVIPKIIQKDDWRLDLARRWDSVVGSLQTKIRLEKTYDDTAVIGVYESHWMQELYLLADELCNSINDVIGQQKIRKIRFTLVEQREKPLPKKQPKKLVLPKEVSLSSQQTAALNKLTDPALKKVMKEFWTRCLAKEVL